TLAQFLGQPACLPLGTNQNGNIPGLQRSKALAILEASPVLSCQLQQAQNFRCTSSRNVFIAKRRFSIGMKPYRQCLLSLAVHRELARVTRGIDGKEGHRIQLGPVFLYAAEQKGSAWPASLGPLEDVINRGNHALA